VKTLKFRQYKTELINGSKGKINIPLDLKLQDIITSRKFIEDAQTKTFIRSNSIVMFEYIGIHELSVSEDLET